MPDGRRAERRRWRLNEVPMKLESAFDLKQHLLTTLVEPFNAVASGSAVSAAHVARLKSVGAADLAAGFAVGAKALDSLPAVQRSVALGVARRDNKYQLAVRVQRQALLRSPLVERLIAEANGEVDVRLIGRIDKRTRSRASKSTRSPSAGTRRISSHIARRVAVARAT